ncbi:MAG: hypothetical protein OJF52_003722 [Nitrospira sp.]|nr:MAG: hypothetical protein OJF52_003722 [Nitrospira sp.]
MTYFSVQPFPAEVDLNLIGVLLLGDSLAHRSLSFLLL